MRKWSQEDALLMLKLGGIFVVAGIVFGLFRGDGILYGALAGLLLFGLFVGVGSLVELLR